jgi:MoaA/NifB/PqqE/SkfB family radical SAM enzyme
MILPDFPFRVEFEVISVCNLDCAYCYAKPLTHMTPPIEHLQYLFEKTKEEANPFETILLGGEPFLRRDIIDVIQLASRTFEYGVGISTNGTLLSRLSRDRRIFELEKAVKNGVSLQISMDSVDPKVNEKTRGNTRAVLEGLRTLEEYDIPFSVGIVLTTSNAGDVVATSRQLLTRFGQLKTINLEPLQPTMALGEDYFGLRLDSEKMVQTLKAVNGVVADLGRKDVKTVGVIEDCSKIEEGTTPLLETYGFKSCTAGLLRAGVFANGEVTPCVTLRDVSLGNLYSESWRDIWKRSKERFLSLDSEGGQCHLNNLRRDASKQKLAVLNK